MRGALLHPGLDILQEINKIKTRVKWTNKEYPRVDTPFLVEILSVNANFRNYVPMIVTNDALKE